MRTGYTRVDPKELIGSVPCDKLGYSHDFDEEGVCVECSSLITWELQEEIAQEAEAERRAEAHADAWTI